MTSLRIFMLLFLALASGLIAGCNGGPPAPPSATSIAPSAPQEPSAAADAASGKPVVRIGSTNFAEQSVLAEIYAVALEGRGYKVQRKFNLGTREVVFPALQSGQIDLEGDYLATLLLFVDRNAQASSDPDVVAQALQQVLTPRKLTLLQYAPAVDTNGFAVTRATSDRYNLHKLSDLQSVASRLILGGAPECPQRPFCLRGLEDVYGLKFNDFKPLDTGGPITVAALESDQVQVAEMFTTDPQIGTHNFVLLEDDQHIQRADNVAPVIRTDILNSDIGEILNAIAPKLTTAELTALNAQVGIQKREPKQVAQEWLAAR